MRWTLTLSLTLRYVQSLSSLSAGGPEEAKVWVCCNRWCRERGASIPLGAAIALTAGQDVSVSPHKCFGRCTIGPNVAALKADGSVMEYHRVDSVEKVSAILMRLGAEIDWQQARSLEFSVQAGRVAEKEPELAVAAHTAALETGREDQAAVALVGRAEARLDLAQLHANRIARLMRSTRVRPTNHVVIKARLISFLATTLSLPRPKNNSNDDVHEHKAVQPIATETNQDSTKTEWWKLSSLGSVLSSEGAKIRRRASASILAALRFRRQDVITYPTPATSLVLKSLADLLFDDAAIAAIEFDSKMFEIEVRRALEDSLQAAKLLRTYARCWRVASRALATLGVDDTSATQFAQLASDLDLASSDQDSDLFDDDDLSDDDLSDDDDDDLPPVSHDDDTAKTSTARHKDNDDSDDDQTEAAAKSSTLIDPSGTALEDFVYQQETKQNTENYASSSAYADKKQDDYAPSDDDATRSKMKTQKKNKREARYPESNGEERSTKGGGGISELY